MQDMKLAVHQLTNHLQSVLGYIELERYKEALGELKKALTELKGLTAMISGMVVHRMPKDSVVVIPHGTRTVSSEDVTVDVPVDAVSIVPESDVRKGQGKHNRRSK